MSNVGQHLLSGGLSGFASTICLQPLDLLKTRLQQGDGSSGPRFASPTFTCVTIASTSARNLTVFRTARDIVAIQGPRGLWRGTNATLVRNVPGIALYMTALTHARSVMAVSPYFKAVQKYPSGDSRTRQGSVLPTLTMQGNLLSGATTRVAVGFILNPFSVLKARFESSIYAYESLSGGFMSIVRAGPSELFRGFLASSLRDAPYAGLFVVFYEGLKIETYWTSHTTSAGIHSFSAASAGALATIFTHPFDVIKTKVQVRSEARYHGLYKTIRTIMTQRGIAGFFDGVSLRLSRKVFSSAIGWAVYEGMLMLMASA
ncbi:hypothetical protein JAAARDRAFT_53029 [Jaapia argillacea MUCL 33604]|uniref:Mitochondrial glycine transporter n=1 Tax=Jaapia argillacea MUCL 33604 TaxID=933084 RepID=A0A067QDU5_9AGAM|nr:hypothetical protein JAAARDRAFT_53029 [Jaapia argillacea MUCL 33604]